MKRIWAAVVAYGLAFGMMISSIPNAFALDLTAVTKESDTETTEVVVTEEPDTEVVVTEEPDADTADSITLNRSKTGYVEDCFNAQGIPSLETRRARINSATLHPMKTNVSEIDTYIENLLNRITTSDMDTYTKVKACYDYLINNWSYGSNGIWYLNNYPYYYMYESSYDAMMALYGYESLKTNIGVCDNYAAAFVLLTRRIGLESYSVGGRIGRTEDSKLGHAWVNIKINGTYYLFDPQVEDNVTKNGVINYYFFCMLDSETWSGYEYDNREGRIAQFRNFNVFRWTNCSISPEGTFTGGSSKLTVATAGKDSVEYEIYCKSTTDSEYDLYDTGSGGTYTINLTQTGQYDIRVIARASYYATLTKDFKYNVLDKSKVDDFIQRLYSKCLNRTADDGGLKYWENALLSPSQSGASVAYGFVFSSEYKAKKTTDAEYVEMLYTVFMNRGSDVSGKQYWTNLLSQGLSREYVYNGFATSKEFAAICSSYGITRGSITLTQARDKNAELTKYVNRIYVKAMGRSGEPDGLNYWCTQIQTKKMTPTQVAEQFIYSEEFTKKKLSDEEYIKVLYRTFMGREYDQAGLNYWLGQIKSGKTRKQVLKSFAGCPEFQNIIKSFGL